MRFKDGDRLAEGDPVRLKSTGEVGHIIHVFSIYPFKGDVVVLVGEQVTIPKEIRRALGIKEGDSLLFEVEGEDVRLRVARNPVSFGDYAGAWRKGEGRAGRR